MPAQFTKAQKKKIISLVNDRLMQITLLYPKLSRQINELAGEQTDPGRTNPA